MDTHCAAPRRRRSPRLQGRPVSTNADEVQKKPRAKSKKSTSSVKSVSNKRSKTELYHLPRTRERELHQYSVMGVDEAGRGPLAGPVVAAAAIVPHSIPGIMDSKTLVKEEERERLYDLLVTSPEIQWAVAVMDAARIDEINILQATLEGMRMAASAVMEPHKHKNGVKEPCVSILGSYVVCSSAPSSDAKQFYALIDGNRLPKDMPCEAETMVKGDSKEYCIAAASILAKVTRDRLMRAYDKMYPLFELCQNKGYPTAAHMALVRKHGASPIHRRTFAPLKHMEFDKDGNIVSDESSS